MTNLPVSGSFYVTATFGQQGSFWAKGHQGIDLVAENRNVYATCDGVVRVVAYDANGWGQYVSVGEENGRRHIFCHLVQGSVKVKPGDRVTRTTVLGVMGASGNVTGTHLHYQLQQGEEVLDPTRWLGIPNQIGTYHSADYQLKEEDTVFRDENLIPAWAKEAVQKAEEQGLMLGDPDGNFRPNDPITRAELAVVLSRLNLK